jgi:uncharacterized protein (DUF1499 family)
MDTEDLSRMKWATMANPWIWLAGGGAAVWIWVNRRLFLVNDVTAGESTAYPDLKPHAYAYPPAQVFALAEATARDVRDWDVQEVHRERLELTALCRTCRTPIVGDVTINVRAIPETQVCEVIVRSRSHVGVGDLGVSARRVAAFYHSLDERIRNAGSEAPETASVDDDPAPKGL